MPMDIDVRMLRSFVSIYERGSLSRAAEHMSCTQAAMSMRLKLMETELGESLFHRHHHKLEPTFKAIEFYAKALSVLAAYDEMISSTRNKAQRSKIRLGIPDDYAISYLRRALLQAGSLMPRIEIEIICGLSANLATSLSRHEVDIALVTLSSPPPDSLATIEMPLHWVVDPEFSPAPNQPVGLVAYPEGCVFRRHMIHALDSAGMPWAVVAQSQNRSGILAALQGRVGVSAMAAGTAPKELRELQENAWLPQLPSVPISILTASARLSDDGRALAEEIRSELLRHQAMPLVEAR